MAAARQADHDEGELPRLREQQRDFGRRPARDAECARGEEQDRRLDGDEPEHGEGDPGELRRHHAEVDAGARR